MASGLPGYGLLIILLLVCSIGLHSGGSRGSKGGCGHQEKHVRKYFRDSMNLFFRSFLLRKIENFYSKGVQSHPPPPPKSATEST